MTHEKIIRRLNTLAVYHSQAADRAETQHLAEDILEQRAWIIAARKALAKLTAENDELKSRLVRQACFLEVIEARHEPRWPLLRDDDPGAAL
ncbi:MAG: hypothetical protein WD060_10505 [Pirellulales bacterium]